MSNLKLDLPSVPTYAAWADHMRTRLPRSGKVGHNTYVHGGINFVTSQSYIAIRYHNTDIVTIYDDDSVKLNSGGWRTSTTKNRMGKILSPLFTVGQKDFEWFVYRIGDWDNPIPYHDGIIINIREWVS